MKANKLANHTLNESESEGQSTQPGSHSYSQFDRIDGSHSYKKVVPSGYVDYSVRTRPGGQVFYFNFKLAKKMGLLPDSHPETLDRTLKEKLLHTFSLVIINEYDLEKKINYPSHTIRKNRYMATRYLQLQHPNKRGKTSGDGRGIWNGEITHKGLTWDISSSGTGATKLSPAHAQSGRFFKTGDTEVGYGNGYNCVTEGLSAALMSEMFHKNGIKTEQTLLIITFEGGSSINVRANLNLLRPAHFFRLLKLEKYDELKSLVKYFIEREVSNGVYPKKILTLSEHERYRWFANKMAETFAEITARYESDYIFCWLDWDGDNILANGGIIDYGSIRQFGLYHWEYRYDDVDRMSTNIPEQKLKARTIVQNFAQIADYLIYGKKRRLHCFKNSPATKLFDSHFKTTLLRLLTAKLGFTEAHTEYLLKHCPKTLKKFKKHHSYFEKVKSARGVYSIDDGITCDAIFSMSDLHKVLPKIYLTEQKVISAKKLIDLIKSSYAKPKDLSIPSSRKTHSKRLQKSYLKLVRTISKEFYNGDDQKLLLELMMRASIKNPNNRITGDGVLHVTSSLIRNQKKLSLEERLKVIESIIHAQIEPTLKPHTKAGKIASRNLKALASYREGF